MRPGETLQTREQILNLIHIEDLPHHRAMIECAVREGRGWHDGFRIVRRRDGEITWIEERATAARSPDTARFELTGILWDVSDRKQAKAGLTESEQALALELRATKRLDELSTRLLQASDLSSGLNEIVGACMALTAADMGNVQLYDPETASLRIAAQRGFGPEFLEYFSVVRVNEGSACARALKGEQVLVRDIQTDADFAPHRDVAARAGFQSVQSTPILTSRGHIIGVLSTHYRLQHCPSDRDLRLLEVYAQRAADWITHMRAHAALSMSERQFEAVANLVPDLLWSSGPDGLTNWCNQRWSEYTGQSAEQYRGLGWLDAIHPEDRKNALGRLGEMTDAGRAVRFQHRVRAADGSYRWFLVRGEPVRDENGKIVRSYGALTDVDTERKALCTVEAMLAEKQALLKELQHRVKNNLQVIASLLSIQASKISDPETLTLFDEAVSRVRAVAGVHDMLYSSNSFAAIDFTAYARQLLKQVLFSCGAENRITWNVVGKETHIDLYQAVPFALLLNELVMNVCKHAFPGQGHGELTVAIEQNDEMLALTVADTGVGLPFGGELYESSSFGFQIVRALAEQLGGTLTVGAGPGTQIKLVVRHTDQSGASAA